jgi:hypothetical protein
MTNPTAADFFLAGKDIQNKADRPIGSAGTEDRHFREFFGKGLFVVSQLWNLLAHNDFIPPEGDMKHLLWTLHFLKAYPKQAAICLTVGGSAGAIDPKMLQKYMWPFIRAVADFEPAVVRNNDSVFLHLSNSTNLIFSRLFLKAGKIVAV